MDSLTEFVDQIPQELLLVMGGFLVAFLTQFAKKIKTRRGYDIDPKVLAALIAISFGALYAVLVQVAPDDWMDRITKFGALTFSGAVALYELYKSLIKVPVEKSSRAFPEAMIQIKDPSLVYELVEVERQARSLRIEFEPFSLASIKSGQRNEEELKIHVLSLKIRVEQGGGQ